MRRTPWDGSRGTSKHTAAYPTRTRSVLLLFCFGQSRHICCVFVFFCSNSSDQFSLCSALQPGHHFLCRNMAFTIRTPNPPSFFPMKFRPAGCQHNIFLGFFWLLRVRLEETVQSLRFGEMCSAVEHETTGANGHDAGTAVREALQRIDDEIKDLEKQIRQKEQLWLKNLGFTFHIFGYTFFVFCILVCCIFGILLYTMGWEKLDIEALDVEEDHACPRGG